MYWSYWTSKTKIGYNLIFLFTISWSIILCLLRAEIAPHVCSEHDYGEKESLRSSSQLNDDNGWGYEVCSLWKAYTEQSNTYILCRKSRIKDSFNKWSMGWYFNVSISIILLRKQVSPGSVCRKYRMIFYCHTQLSSYFYLDYQAFL